MYTHICFCEALQRKHFTASPMHIHYYLQISPKIIMIMQLWLLKHYNTFWNSEIYIDR